MILPIDFYEHISPSVIDQLNFLEQEHGTKAWFYEAWMKYRKYIFDSVANGSKKAKYPGYIFNEYLNKEFIRNNSETPVMPIYNGFDYFECPVCGKMFSENVHKRKRRYPSCPKCGVIFKPYKEG